jgi:hypothetical protein
MNARKLTLTTFCTVLAVLVLGVVPALATQTRLYTGTSFGPGGTSASSFQEPGSVTFDQESKDLYVADYAAGAVYKFNEAGEPVNFTGSASYITGNELTGIGFAFETLGSVKVTDDENQIAVDSKSGILYVTSKSSLKAFQANGEPADFSAIGTNEITGFGELLGVTVDASGDIYASAYGGGVSVYTPTGEPLTALSVGASSGVVVDAHGVIYVQHFHGQVEKFIPSSFPVTASTTYQSTGFVDPAEETSAVTIDPTSGNLFVDGGSKIAEYDEAGDRVAEFAGFEASAISGSEGISVDGATDHVYVSNSGTHQVEIFGPPVDIAEATTGAASEVQVLSATVAGTVNPASLTSEITDCRFEYVTEEFFQLGLEIFGNGYGLFLVKSAPCLNPDGSNASTIAAGRSEHPVHADLTGLSGGTKYHFRVSATNANGVASGADQTFTTLFPFIPPSIDSTSTANVTATTADLRAEVNPNHYDTRYHFEYLTEAEFASEGFNAAKSTPEADLGPAGTDQRLRRAPGPRTRNHLSLPRCGRQR